MVGRFYVEVVLPSSGEEGTRGRGTVQGVTGTEVGRGGRPNGGYAGRP